MLGIACHYLHMGSECNVVNEIYSKKTRAREVLRPASLFIQRTLRKKSFFFYFKAIVLFSIHIYNVAYSSTLTALITTRLS
jgi:hypothetical protein